jgi:hypothetical protein
MIFDGLGNADKAFEYEARKGVKIMNCLQIQYSKFTPTKQQHYGEYVV